MAGLDWHALPVVCEVLGVEDVERLVQQLLILRNAMREETRG